MHKILNVTALQKALEEMPPKANIWYVWDGACRTQAVWLWLTRDGCVVLAGEHDLVYSDTCRPHDAPLKAEDPYWETPSKRKS